jgi:hypothetical protein
MAENLTEHTTMNLMHQVSISITDALAEKFGNPKYYDFNQSECCEMEPNPSKDRAMHKGDKPNL